MDEKALQGFLRAAGTAYQARFTRFLDPAEAREVEAAAKAMQLPVVLWGGYPYAERCIAAVGGDAELAKDAFPLSALESTFESRFGSITHRDVLGAFMGLGLTRDCIGDIIIKDSTVYLFVVKSMEKFVMESLTGAGRMKLCFHRFEDPLRIPEPEGTYFRGTVSSLRLDALLAEGFRLSRSDAAELVRAGRVKVSHVPVIRTDAQVEAGALLSIAGIGRVQLRSVDGLTRKQRIGVTFFRYQ